MEIGAQILLAGIRTVHALRLHRVAPPFMAGVGVILTFHHVRPARPNAFQPNRHLEVTPEFLDALVAAIRAAGDDIVSLDEAQRRLIEGDLARRFVVLTFDDGYRDIREHAYPVLKRHAAPFTIFVASRFADGSGDLWWIALERTIAASSHLETRIGESVHHLELSDDDARSKAFTTLYWALRALPDEHAIHTTVHDIAAAAGISPATLCRDLCMGWSELAELAADPLVTLGAHTDTHIILSKAPADCARADILRGLTRMEGELGILPAHLCYPVGDRTSAGPREFGLAEEFGFRTALTTRRGVLYAEHRDHLTALPRISVNGNYQSLSYMETLLSGIPTAFANRFARLDVR